MVRGKEITFQSPSQQHEFKRVSRQRYRTGATTASDALPFLPSPLQLPLPAGLAGLDERHTGAGGCVCGRCAAGGHYRRRWAPCRPWICLGPEPWGCAVASMACGGGGCTSGPKEQPPSLFPGTDGLFDNVYPEEIAAIVASGREEGQEPGKVAARVRSLR